MTLADVQTLAKKGLFPDSDQEAQLIETHANWVLLTTEYAYKIKKPVDFSFLDYSTLEKRRFYCEEEVRLNNRLTRDVYLGVMPVGKTDAGPSIGIEGSEVLDYAVRMRRLPADRQMNLLMQQKKVTPTHIHAIARILADFHQHAEKLDQMPSWDSLYEDFADLQSISSYVEEHLGTSQSRIIKHAIEVARQFLETYQDRLAERAAAGFFVDGHGDLHSGNIFLLKEPVLFDCIEFNEHFRQVDVLDELAFLFMDLEYYGASTLAKVLLDTYLALFSCMPEPIDQRLFAYFKAYRANVRLKVTSLKGMQQPEKPAPKAEMQRYLELLQSYLDDMILPGEE